METGTRKTIENTLDVTNDCVEFEVSMFYIMFSNIFVVKDVDGSCLFEEI